jgi:hypothetical protein
MEEAVKMNTTNISKL